VLNICAAKVSILLTEKYYFHIWWIAKYILFYKPEPAVCWLWSVLDDLSIFEYIEIMMMFWSMNMIYDFRLSILLIEKYYFHIWWIAKYILFYKSEPTVCWLWSVLDDLSTFEYIEIMMMFWSMNMICDFRVSINWRFKLCKLSKKWYVGLFMFYEESMC